MAIRKSFSQYSNDELIFDFGLYNSIYIDTNFEEITIDNSKYGGGSISFYVHTSKEFRKLVNFIRNPLIVHSYCPFCKKEHTFDWSPIAISEALANSIVLEHEYRGMDPWENEGLEYSIKEGFDEKITELKKINYFTKTASCKLEPQKLLLVTYCIDISLVDDKYIIKLKKVGQNPSIADFYTNKYRKYKKYLDTINSYHDYTHSHYAYVCGQGISAYAYIRRVFESIVIGIYKEFKDSLEVQKDEEAFIKMPMVNKLKELNEYLPRHLKNNQKIYELLSVGIHPVLNEEECIDGFPIISEAIDYFIDDEIQRKDKGKKEENMKRNAKEINELYDSVKKKI